MTKVITYGTYDLLHYGHINLLKRAKELGDYLIVGVTADDFDKRRGKINVQQSLTERIENVQKPVWLMRLLWKNMKGRRLMILRTIMLIYLLLVLTGKVSLII